MQAERSALDFVTVVDVAGREDGIYVFTSRHDADRFEAAVNRGSSVENPAFLSETPVNVGDAAERLIAAERGDAFEDMGWHTAAEDLREGVAPSVVIDRIGDVRASERAEPIALLQCWAEEDAKGGES